MASRTAATSLSSSRARWSQTAAVAVGAAVGGRRQKAAHDRGVRTLQLDAVEPAGHAVLGHPGVPGDDLGDLVRLDRLGHLPEQRIRHRARRPDREAGVEAGGLPAVVVDLGQDRHPVGVHGVGDAAVPGDDLGVKAVDELLVRPVGGVGRVLLGDDQAGAPGGPGR